MFLWQYCGIWVLLVCVGAVIEPPASILPEEECYIKTNHFIACTTEGISAEKLHCSPHKNVTGLMHAHTTDVCVPQGINQWMSNSFHNNIYVCWAHLDVVFVVFWLDCVQLQTSCCKSHIEEEKQKVPECMYAVDAAWHVLSVIYVCGFWVEDLKQRQCVFSRSTLACRSMLAGMIQGSSSNKRISSCECVITRPGSVFVGQLKWKFWRQLLIFSVQAANRWYFGADSQFYFKAA